jgi:hypothetical protein
VNFEATVLKRDGTEIVWFIGANFFGKEDNVGLVNRPEISGKRMEVIKGRGQVIFHEVPILFVEGRSKTVRTRTGIIVHGEEGFSDFG